MLRSYIIGFIASIVLSLVAYGIVAGQLFRSSTATIIAILILALVQLGVQLIFFLHLGQESKPRWNFFMFLFAGIVLLILVLGSLWIMYNLDYQMMPKMEIDHQIMDEEAIHK